MRSWASWGYGRNTGADQLSPKRAVEVKNTCNTRAEISYLNCG
jgi:hypothetical protein